MIGDVIRAALIERVGRVAGGQLIVLEIDVGIAVQGVAALPGHDIEDGTLNIAVFGGGAER
jgi:hypothetical protein